MKMVGCSRGSKGGVIDIDGACGSRRAVVRWWWASNNFDKGERDCVVGSVGAIAVAVAVAVTVTVAVAIAYIAGVDW